MQIREDEEEVPYHFSADYVLIDSGDPKSDGEINRRINSLVTHSLNSLRTWSKSHGANKDPNGLVDSIWISHNVSLFTDRVLSLEFQLGEYAAGAAHPNAHTRAINFGLSPTIELGLERLFVPSSNYLELLSSYSIEDIQRQKAQRNSESSQFTDTVNAPPDQWLREGAAPFADNFERCSLRRHGLVVHFDAYHVDCYAAGKYEVFVPAYKLSTVIEEDVATLLGWPHEHINRNEG